VAANPTLLFNGNKNPITCLTFDEESNLLWFASSGDSSIKNLNLNKRSLEKLQQEKVESDVIVEQPDYELQGLPSITEYHILRNKRYIVTNNSVGKPQLWNLEKGKLIKTYNSKSFEDLKTSIATKYDLQDNQTPFPMGWFSVDIKLGCLTLHLDEENWNKCTVSEMATNVQLMQSTHMMDQN